MKKKIPCMVETQRHTVHAARRPEVDVAQNPVLFEREEGGDDGEGGAREQKVKLKRKAYED